MDRLRIGVFLLAMLGSVPGLALAQDSNGNREVVDRVVAVVGDSAILQTDLLEEVYRVLANAGIQQLPENEAERDRLFRSALDSRVNDLLLLQAAERDSILVTLDEVKQQVDRQLSQQQRAFGGQPAFEEALHAQGLTLAGYRAQLTEQIRAQGMIERYVSEVTRTRRPPPVTDTRAKRYFEEQRDQLGNRPATIDMELVVLVPSASDSAKAAAREEAGRLLGRIREGEDFEQLARRYSDDPGTKDLGGDLGWFRESGMVREFARAAFSLPPGAVSGIVETSYGYHIIKVEKIKAAERKARHILISPALTDIDEERTWEKAESVLDLLRDGAPIDSLVRTYGDPADLNQGKVGPIPIDNLPPPFDEVLRDVGSGELVGPIRLPGGQGSDRLAVLRVTNRMEEGPYDWEDPVVRAQIRQQLERQLLMEEIIRELRERTFVDLRL